MSSPRRRAVAAMALSGAISAALISTPAASAGIADGTAFPTQSATPHLPDSTSANWAGYVASGGGYTSVSAAWTQPGVSCTSQTSYASFWVDCL